MHHQVQKLRYLSFEAAGFRGWVFAHREYAVKDDGMARDIAGWRRGFKGFSALVTEIYTGFWLQRSTVS
jgi:hypothetical protein